MRYGIAKVLGGFILLALPAAAEDVPTFPQTFPQFELLLNATIREDANDPAHPDGSSLKRCRLTKAKVMCSFGDAAFRRSLDEFKRLNIMNGRFTDKLELSGDLAPNGHLQTVYLNGDRSDPVNLFEWVGTVIDVIRVWDPEVGRGDDLKEIGSQLGLMRGDDASDIGQPKVDIFDHVAVTCISAPTSDTTSVICKFEPRS